MKTRWLALLTVILTIALITACDTKQTTVVVLKQPTQLDDAWSYEMQPIGILEETSCTDLKATGKTDAQKQWEFVSLQEGDVTVSFVCNQSADYPTYMTYQYRVAADGSISIVGINGNLPANS